MVSSDEVGSWAPSDSGTGVVSETRSGVPTVGIVGSKGEVGGKRRPLTSMAPDGADGSGAGPPAGRRHGRQGRCGRGEGLLRHRSRQRSRWLLGHQQGALLPGRRSHRQCMSRSRRPARGKRPQEGDQRLQEESYLLGAGNVEGGWVDGLEWRGSVGTSGEASKGRTGGKQARAMRDVVDPALKSNGVYPRQNTQHRMRIATPESQRERRDHWARSAQKRRKQRKRNDDLFEHAR